MALTSVTTTPSGYPVIDSSSPPAKVSSINASDVTGKVDGRRGLHIPDSRPLISGENGRQKALQVALFVAIGIAGASVGLGGVATILAVNELTEGKILKREILDWGTEYTNMRVDTD